jgi:hypothetical protein
MRTLVTDTHGELPVLGIWRRCRHTRTGWTGVREDGAVVDIRYRPEEREWGPARMPPKDYVVVARAAAAHEFGDVAGHVTKGVILIERASPKKKAPAVKDGESRGR